MHIDITDEIKNMNVRTPISMSKEDILEKIRSIESHGERINELYRIIDHGDEPTKKHAWDILEDSYDDCCVKDGADATERLMKNKDHHRAVSFTSK